MDLAFICTYSCDKGQNHTNEGISKSIFEHSSLTFYSCHRKLDQIASANLFCHAADTMDGHSDIWHQYCFRRDEPITAITYID